jgi:hypothetical protein
VREFIVTAALGNQETAGSGWPTGGFRLRPCGNAKVVIGVVDLGCADLPDRFQGGSSFTVSGMQKGPFQARIAAIRVPIPTICITRFML